MASKWTKVRDQVGSEKHTSIKSVVDNATKKKEEEITSKKGDGGLEDFEGFVYITKRKGYAPICFGSSGCRDCLPLSGGALSSFMRRFTPAVNEKVSPATYELSNFTALSKVLNKKRSTKGIIGEEVRFRDVKSIAPPATKYNLRAMQTRVRRNKAPFLQKGPRQTERISITPGPGNYNEFYKRQFPVNESFGGQRRLRISIPIECLPINLYKCEMCRLTPKIDFWVNKSGNSLMCVTCFSEEWYENNKYNTKELRKFVLMRDCSFMHEHSGSSYRQLLTTKEIYTKLSLESYLSQYFTEFLPQPVFEQPLMYGGDYLINFKDTTQFYAQFNKYLMKVGRHKRKMPSRKPNDDEENVTDAVQ